MASPRFVLGNCSWSSWYDGGYGTSFTISTKITKRPWMDTHLARGSRERAELYKPSKLLRFMVLITQGIFVNLFFISYLVSPRYCHRFVGYLEEEAVKTYTKLLKDIEEGNIKHWQTEPAPSIAIKYWKLPENASIRDVFCAIRADEAHHRDVNHTFSELKPYDSNPFGQ